MCGGPGAKGPRDRPPEQRQAEGRPPVPMPCSPAGCLALPGGTDNLQTWGWLSAVGTGQLSDRAAAFLPLNSPPKAELRMRTIKSFSGQPLFLFGFPVPLPDPWRRGTCKQRVGLYTQFSPWGPGCVSLSLSAGGYRKISLPLSVGSNDH